MVSREPQSLCNAIVDRDLAAVRRLYKTIPARSSAQDYNMALNLAMISLRPDKQDTIDVLKLILDRLEPSTINGAFSVYAFRSSASCVIAARMLIKKGLAGSDLKRLYYALITDHAWESVADMIDVFSPTTDIWSFLTDDWRRLPIHKRKPIIKVVNKLIYMDFELSDNGVELLRTMARHPCVSQRTKKKLVAYIAGRELML